MNIEDIKKYRTEEKAEQEFIKSEAQRRMQDRAIESMRKQLEYAVYSKRLADDPRKRFPSFNDPRKSLLEQASDSNIFGNNTAIGQNALLNNTNGANNTACGQNALLSSDSREYPAV